MSAVVLLPYDPAWATHYAAIESVLVAVFAPLPIRVEHIGSTAVPGLAAKPVIDVLLGAPTLADVELQIEALGELGYQYVSKYEETLPQRRYFVRAASATPRVHLHAVEQRSDFWRSQLYFRDCLRADALLCARYQALKQRLAREHASDKAAYTAAKAPFIEAVLATADRR